MTIDSLLSIIALLINKIHLCYFEKCKTEYINLPGDVVSVVLHIKSNDILGATTVSTLAHCIQLLIITILNILIFNAVCIDECMYIICILLFFL